MMDTWHAGMGHIRKEALEKLPGAVDGVGLDTRDFERASELCSECQLAQAHQQISSHTPPVSSTAFRYSGKSGKHHAERFMAEAEPLTSEDHRMPSLCPHQEYERSSSHSQASGESDEGLACWI